VDQEGGRVQRFREPFTIIPSMRELGRMNDADCVRLAGQVMARELRAVNIDMNLAPVLDVDSNPANPVIGERSFGSDPEVVSRLGCAMIEGLQAREAASGLHGVAACGKHFPGHGDTSIDSHFGLPRLHHKMDRLERVELPPFQAAIRAGVASIMVAHVLFEALDPKFPASMSAPIIGELLRKQMGFDGVVCSDDLEMKAIIDHFGIEEAVIRGAIAGIDLFCVCKDHDLQHRALDALIDAVERGDVKANRIAESNRRIDILFDRFVKPASPSVITTHRHSVK
jgi:beta-N-acetylhexosaminidase